MNQIDILKIFCKERPEINRDIEIAQNLIKQNKIDHAGEKYRDAAKRMLSHNMPSFAIDYYSQAANLFIKGGNYLKAINTESSIYNINKLDNNILALANSHEKIASYYAVYVKNDFLAGTFFISSAKHHEENQNYRSAYKKALFASEYFEKTNDTGKKMDAHNLAFRMALQSGYYEKAGEHMLRVFNYIKKDYSAHHISVCVKGYKTFMKVERYEEALMFITEILKAHYDAKIIQHKITKYLKEEQKLTLSVRQSIDIVNNQRMINELGAKTSEIVSYSLEMKQHADNIGSPEASDFFYLQHQEYKKVSYKNSKNYLKFIVYTVWEISCLYGVSLWRWLTFSLIILIVFGCFFSNIPCPSFFPNSMKHFLENIHPEIKVASINNNFTPFYYSVVTFTTLGYGDITPANISAQIFSVVEVFIGYVMLGGLLTVFSKKIIR